MTEPGSFDEQVVGIFEAFGDEATYRLLRQLLREPATQDQLEDDGVKGLDQSGVSRRLKTLAQLGLVRGGGRKGRSEITASEETLAVIRAVIDLVEAINRRRVRDLKKARQDLAGDELASPAKVDRAT